MLMQNDNNKLYRTILKLINTEERHDRNRNVVGTDTILNLSYKRYGDMIQLLKPLRDSLVQNMDVLSLYFTRNHFNEPVIAVEYQDDEGIKTFYIPQGQANGSDIMDIMYDTYNGEYRALLERNQKQIQEVFNGNAEYEFDKETIIPSTSQKFLISEGCDYFSLTDKPTKSFRISSNFKMVDNRRRVDIPYSNNRKYWLVKNVFDNYVNLNLLMHNIKVYEEDIPKHLIKKR